MRNRKVLRHGASLLVLAVAATAAGADGPPSMLGYQDSQFQRGASSHAQPAQLREVGIDPRIGDPVPLDLQLRDLDGEFVRLGELAPGRPLLLVPTYYTCPMLCSMVTGGIVKALRVLDFEPGREFEVVVFSFDPADGPAAARRKRDETLSRIGGDAAAADPPALPGWHFLTGDADSIAALTEAIGFRYTWDEASQQFAHTATLALVTPRGQLSRYYFGLEYAPRDLRLGIIESADEKLGGIADSVMLYCFQYDPSTGRYSAQVLNLVRAAGIATLAAFGLFLFISRRRGDASTPDSGPRGVG